MRGRGAMGKTIVFGLLKRERKVYTEIIPDYSSTTLQAIIRGKARPQTRNTLSWLAFILVF